MRRPPQPASPIRWRRNWCCICDCARRAPPRRRRSPISCSATPTGRRRRCWSVAGRRPSPRTPTTPRFWPNAPRLRRLAAAMLRCAEAIANAGRTADADALARQAWVDEIDTPRARPLFCAVGAASPRPTTSGRGFSVWPGYPTRPPPLARSPAWMGATMRPRKRASPPNATTRRRSNWWRRFPRLCRSILGWCSTVPVRFVVPTAMRRPRALMERVGDYCQRRRILVGAERPGAKAAA